MRLISPKATIHPTAIIPEDSTIGDFVYIGERVKILTPSLHIDDYTKIHQDTFVNGKNQFRLGYNCWIGGHCVLDTLGGLSIGNNVGIGAHSQVWSHIKFGDTLAGCRWNSTKECRLDDDVWLVGHCIVSPVHMEEKSMALVGSVVTKDCATNHVYAGVPAKDITDAVGPQFDMSKQLSVMSEEFLELVNAFVIKYPQYSGKAIALFEDFDLGTRQYLKRSDELQESFLQFCYPLAKFIPFKTVSSSIPDDEIPF